MKKNGLLAAHMSKKLNKTIGKATSMSRLKLSESLSTWTLTVTLVMIATTVQTMPLRVMKLPTLPKNQNCFCNAILKYEILKL